MLLLALLTTPILAFGDKGFSPWNVSPKLSTGALEYFWEIYVDPATWPATLEPKAPASAPGSFGDLPIENTSNAWIEVQVNGQKVGVVGPLTTARIHNVKSGTYELHYTWPNGYALTRTVETVSPPDLPPMSGKPPTDAPQITP